MFLCQFYILRFCFSLFLSYIQMKQAKTINTFLTRQPIMLNLQLKRTLPREVIKWMQGLDLSYSIKDYRKDLANGFLIAEIISRYEPGKIPMHAFQNTFNQGRRDNNWHLLNLFFTKYTLRDVQIQKNQYDKISKGQDHKSEQLYQFICRIYSICTKRSFPESAPQPDLPPTQTNNPNLTASYLLKDEGLEKLSNQSQQNNIQNASSINNSGLIESDVRVPTRKIAPNLDQPSQVDVKSIGVWGDANKMTSKKKSWNLQKQDSHYSQENIDNQKTVFDYLNEILEQCLSSSEKFQTMKKNIFDTTNNYNITQVLKNNLTTLDPEFVCTFLSQVQLSIQQLAPIIIRDINEIWKFFTFFIRMIRVFSEDSAEFSYLCNIVSQYAKNLYEKQPKRLKKVFYDSVFDMLISQIKASTGWRKRERIINMSYDFSGRELSDKKAFLFKLKEKIGSSTSLYIQWLSVLVRQEKGNQISIQGTPQSLLEDYLYYGFQNLSKPNILLRSSALKIFAYIATVNYKMIEDHFMSRCQELTQSTEPQHIHLISKIYYIILNETLESNSYQSLVKGKNNNNLIKVYNPDHEKQTQQLKNKISIICSNLYKLYNKTQHQVLRQIISRKAIPLLTQSKDMMKIFLQQTSQGRSQEFIKGEKLFYEFKSLDGQIDAININSLEESANQILVEIIGGIANGQSELQEYLFLVNFCLDKLNIKKVNMEIWEDITLHIAKPYAKHIQDKETAQLYKIGIQKLYTIYFKYDMKIRQLNQWISESFAQMLAGKNPQAEKIVKQFNQWLNTQYSQLKNQLVRYSADQISEGLDSKGFKNVISIRQNKNWSASPQ